MVLLRINADCSHKATTFDLLECFLKWIHEVQAYIGAYIGLYQTSIIEFFAFGEKKAQASKG